MRTGPKLLIPIIGLLVAIPLYSRVGDPGTAGVTSGFEDPGAAIVSRAIRSKTTGILVETSGVVERVSETQPGSSAQRFLVRLSTDVAVKVVHEARTNPVPLAVGDRVRIRGRYQWSADGGFIGGTHDILEAAGPGGWVLHQGIFYPTRTGSSDNEAS